jgi:catechol 2,3-dioxygenase-like lactoylglutathione lyase family enzyme
MQADKEFGLAKIGQIAIPVRDLNRAVDFYRTKLGMRYLFTASTLAFFDCAGVRLMLSTPESAEFDHPSSVLYYQVDDINLAYQTLVERGVLFDGAPHLIANMDTYDLWMAFFRDSENNLLGIMSEVTRDA